MKKPLTFSIVRPSSLEEASLFLKEHAEEAMVLAGGTDLMPKLYRRQFRPKWLVLLPHLSHLNYVEERENKLVIGALTPLRKLVTEPCCSAFLSFRQALDMAASFPIRQSATLGGNLLQDTRCQFIDKSPLWREGVEGCLKLGGDTCRVAAGKSVCSATCCSDLAPALMVLGASVLFQDGEDFRKVPLTEIYNREDGKRHLLKEPWEILVEIEVPRKKLWSGYRKCAPRIGLDFPEAGVALSLEQKGASSWDARVAVTAMAPGPLYFEKTFPETLFSSPSLWKEWVEQIYQSLHPVDTLSYSPLYRKKMARVLLEELFEQALGECQGTLLSRE